MFATAPAQPFPWQDVLATLAAYGVVAAAVGAIVYALWRQFPAVASRILPPQRQRAVPWSLGHIGLVFMLFICLDLLLGFIRPVSSANSFLAVEVIAHLASGPMNGLATPLDGLSAASVNHYFERPVQVKQEIFALTLLEVLQIAAVLGILMTAVRSTIRVLGVSINIELPGVRPYQLGLSCHRWRADVIAGFLGWLTMTPIVFGIFFVVQQIWQIWPQPRQPHPIEELFRGRPGLDVWLLAVTTTMIVAPIAEELILRGLLLRWLTANPRSADVILLSSLFFAIILGVSTESKTGMSPAVGALLFLVTVGPGYVLFERLTRRWLPRPGAARAIYATSLVFAALHSAVWPTPIPLFFLALGLGFIAYRTQSLIGPMVMHSLFNAVSTLPLIWLQI